MKIKQNKTKTKLADQTEPSPTNQMELNQKRENNSFLGSKVPAHALCAFSVVTTGTLISYPEPSNFLRRMLDEKRRALERTGSNSLQIAHLLYCTAFQITDQRIGPFQRLRFRRA